MRKRLLTIAILGLGIGVMAVTSGAQTADPRLTVADVEKVTGLKGI